MNKVLRNYWLDIALFVVLAVNAASLGGAQSGGLSGQPNVAWHVHVVSGILLALACAVHIGLHWKWFQAVFTGKARGRINLAMKGMVVVMMILAGASGQMATHSLATRRFHDLTGVLALLGLFIHAVRHLRWMAVATRKLIASSRQENAGISA
jgi:hypothetical protein